MAFIINNEMIKIKEDNGCLMDALMVLIEMVCVWMLCIRLNQMFYYYIFFWRSMNGW